MRALISSLRPAAPPSGATATLPDAAAPISRRRHLAVTLGAVVLLIASAQISVPFAPWGVPFTLQAHTVLAVAALLGRRAAVTAVVTYLTLGALGAPVFAGLSGGALHLMGPRAGYLWSFVATAWWMGGVSRPPALWRWATASMFTLFVGWVGLVPWLGAAGAWQAGVMPFCLADLAKAAALWAAFRLAGAVKKRAT